METKRGTVYDAIFDMATGKQIEGLPISNYHGVMLSMASALYDPKIVGCYNEGIENEQNDLLLRILVKEILFYLHYKTLDRLVSDKAFKVLKKHYLNSSEGGNAEYAKLYKENIIELISEIWGEEQTMILSLIKTSKLNLSDENYERIVKDLSTIATNEGIYYCENTNEDVEQRLMVYKHLGSSFWNPKVLLRENEIQALVDAKKNNSINYGACCVQDELVQLMKNDPLYKDSSIPGYDLESSDTCYNPQKVEHY